MYLKIRRRDGVESLTILVEGEFKVPIDGCINLIYIKDVITINDNDMLSYSLTTVQRGFTNHIKAICPWDDMLFFFLWFWLFLQ